MDAFLEFCLFLRICSVHALMLLEAFAAVNGSVVAGLERNLCGFSTFRANCIKHLTLAATLSLAGSTASFAADGFILESFFRVELLLSCGKDELRATIFAHQHFVFEHVSFPFWPVRLMIISIRQCLTWLLPPHPPTGRFAPKPFGSPLLLLSDRSGWTYI